jgi:hypothetical protein
MGKLSPSAVTLLHEGVTDRRPVRGYTHNFYKYPARFSPRFVQAVISSFTSPGDIVLDPFAGGGTTAVEALAAGRTVVAADVNSLATFVTAAKTRLYTLEQTRAVADWLGEVHRLSSRDHAPTPGPRHLNRKETWRLRRTIASALHSVSALNHPHEQMLAKCIILRTAQWALDGRKSFPSVQQFWGRLHELGQEILSSATSFAFTLAGNSQPQAFCLNCPAAELVSQFKALRVATPKLILTSPPYPGVHVLYHRWQILGGLETAAPYWIAGIQDGHGAAYYSMGSRSVGGVNSYFDRIKACFEQLRAISNGHTRCVQLVGFSDSKNQLPRYLDAMNAAGWQEFAPAMDSATERLRLWRSVPNRKWYATLRGNTGASREVALFLKPRASQLI